MKKYHPETVKLEEKPVKLDILPAIGVLESPVQVRRYVPEGVPDSTIQLIVTELVPSVHTLNKPVEITMQDSYRASPHPLIGRRWISVRPDRCPSPSSELVNSKERPSQSHIITRVSTNERSRHSRADAILLVRIRQD